jgi:hypothetical protein
VTGRGNACRSRCGQGSPGEAQGRGGQSRDLSTPRWAWSSPSATTPGRSSTLLSHRAAPTTRIPLQVTTGPTTAHRVVPRIRCLERSGEPRRRWRRHRLRVAEPVPPTAATSATVRRAARAPGAPRSSRAPVQLSRRPPATCQAVSHHRRVCATRRRVGDSGQRGGSRDRPVRRSGTRTEPLSAGLGALDNGITEPLRVARIIVQPACDQGLTALSRR